MVTVRIRAYADTTDGFATCDTIDIQPGLSDARMVEVARHEMGHILGLRHSGMQDDQSVPLSQTAPSMATCQSSFPQPYLQDDEASLTYQHSTLQPRALVSNLGFEKGQFNWSLSNQGAFSYVNDTNTVTFPANNGSYYGRFTPVGGADTLFQADAYVPTSDHTLQAVANFRKQSGTYAGSAKVELVVRTIIYGAASGCAAESDQYVIPRDLNNRSVVTDYFIAATATCGVGTTFSTCLTPTYSVSSANNYGYDIKTRIYSGLKLNSVSTTPAPLDIDDLRTRETS